MTGMGMLTRDEVEALAQLLTRIPASAAEALWANGVLDRLRMLARMEAAATTTKTSERGDEGSPPATP